MRWKNFFQRNLLKEINNELLHELKTAYYNQSGAITLPAFSWTDGKNVAIGGPSGSGKSTLAHALSIHFKLSRYPIDPLIHAVEKAFPNLGIAHNDPAIINNLRPFLSELFCALPSNAEGSRFVVDSCYFTPELLSGLDPKKWNTLFVGCPDLDVEDFIYRIQSGPRDNWMKWDLKDQQLKDWLVQARQQSIDLQNSCRESGIYFLNNSQPDYQALVSIVGCKKQNKLWE